MFHESKMGFACQIALRAGILCWWSSWCNCLPPLKCISQTRVSLCSFPLLILWENLVWTNIHELCGIVNPTAYPILLNSCPWIETSSKCFLFFFLSASNWTTLGSLANGEIITVTGSGTHFGTVVNYTCNTGYDLVVFRYSVCQTNGTWSHTAPSCHRK